MPAGIFGNTQQMLQDPQYQNANYPDPNGYRTIDDYNAAVDAYNAANANQPWNLPAGQAPGTFTGPGGEQWYSAGSQRMADMTAGQYQADLLNHRLQQAAMHPGSPDYKTLELALMSRNQVRPDEMQNAYMARGGDGTSVLAGPIAALLERIGVRPPGYDISGVGVTGSAPGVGGAPGGPTHGGTLVGPGGPAAVAGGPPVFNDGSHGPPPPGGHYAGDILVNDNPSPTSPWGWVWQDGRLVPNPYAHDALTAAAANPPNINWSQLTKPGAGAGGSPPPGVGVGGGGGDHPGMINIDGEWIVAPGNIVPQSPYPTLPDAHNIPPDMIGQHPLQTGVPFNPSTLGQGWYMPGANDLVAHYGPMPPGAVPIQQSPSSGQTVSGTDWQNFLNWAKTQQVGGNHQRPVQPPTGYGY